MNKFTIVICSDFEYKKLVVDLQYDYDQVAILNSDYGIDNAEIRFYGIEPRILIFKFRVSEFIEFLNKSFDEFKEYITSGDLNHKNSHFNNFHENITINKSQNPVNQNAFYSISSVDENAAKPIFELYYETLRFATLRNDTENAIEILIYDPNSPEEIWRFDCSEFIHSLKQAFEVLKSNEKDNNNHFGHKEDGFNHS